MLLPESLHIGPSGWTRPDWNSSVYPEQPPRGWHPLDVLSRYVNMAEIDQTFQEPLKPEIARLYVSRVAHRPDFLFSALLGRRFTYDRDLEPGNVEEWKEGMLPLLESGRLGAVVMQFPWAFRFTEENRQFLIAIRRAFHEFPIAAEMRHESWLRDEAVTTLVHHRIGFVNIDQPQYFRAMPPTAVLTSSVAVVRLHGRRNPAAFQEFCQTGDGSYLYDLDELLEWKPRLERLSVHAARTLVSATNSAAGRGMVNALQLQEILGQRRLIAPGVLAEQYPAELAAFRVRRTARAA